MISVTLSVVWSSCAQTQEPLSWAFISAVIKNVTWKIPVEFLEQWQVVLFNSSQIAEVPLPILLFYIFIFLKKTFA